MSLQTMQQRYLGESVTTASPAKLVTMLYDRLVRDLVVAEAALAAGDAQSANAQLIHAQDIIWELLAGLDTTAWSGAPGLASLYQFLISELLAANIAKDATRVATCRGLVEPLRDAWHQAAAQVATDTVTASA